MCELIKNCHKTKTILFIIILPSAIIFYGISILINVITSNSIAYHKVSDFELDPYIKFKELEYANKLAIGWLLHNFNDEGYFVYVYNPSTYHYSQNNNMIRQFMGSRVFMALREIEEC